MGNCILIDKALRVFLRIGCKCKSVNPPHLPLCDQYTPFHKIIRVEDETAVLQATHLCAFLHTEVVILESNIERCQNGALAKGEIVAPYILHRLSIECITVMTFVVSSRLPAEEAEIDGAAQCVCAYVPCQVKLSLKLFSGERVDALLV